MKELSVGIIGIPIKLEKKKNSTKEFFEPGLTDSLREKVIKEIKKSKKIKVIDLGELIDDEDNSGFKNIIGISKTRLDNLAKELKERINGMDLVIVFGGTHTGAYLLYHLPGRIERFDLHEDDYEVEMPFNTSYMKYASELKNSSEISTHGWEDLLNGMLDEGKKDSLGQIFDIDIDYYTSTEYCKLTDEKTKEHLQNIASGIKKTKPRIIGIFEYQNLDGTNEGMKRIFGLVMESIRVSL